MTTGTHSIQDLLAATFANIVDFGYQGIVDILNADIAAHNVIVSQIVGDLCEVSTDRQRIYGTSATGAMIEVDEFGRAPTQKPQVGATCAFPLRNFQYAIGWTDKWLQTKTPADLAKAVLAAEKAHLRAIRRQIQFALYNPTNYVYLDHLVDNVALNVRALVNADGLNIPDGPNGEQFNGAVHTHYDALAGGITAVAAQALIDDVVEHGFGSDVRVAINRANEAAWRALAGFTPYQDPKVLVGSATAEGVKKLDVTRLDNRAIGVFGGAEVWVKPWALDHYPVAYDAGNSNKPLVFRQRSATSVQGLRLAAQNSAYPLHAQFMEAEFGIAPWTRTAAATVFDNGAAYIMPTLP